MADQPDYYDRLLHDVLTAVVEAGAVNALCLAICVLNNSGSLVDTPKQRRELADHCRSEILKASATRAKRGEAGGPLPWPLDAVVGYQRPYTAELMTVRGPEFPTLISTCPK